MKTWCCVPKCANSGGHLFPKNITLRRKWVIAIRRDNWKPTATSAVCKKHFLDSDYIKTSVTGAPLQIKKLKADVVPSLFMWAQKKEASSREIRLLKRNSATVSVKAIEVLTSDCLVPECSDDSNYNVQELHLETYICCNVNVETEATWKSVEVQTKHYDQPSTTSTETQTDLRNSIFDVLHLRNNSKVMHFYTGLETFTKFVFVFESLGSASFHLKYFCNSPPSHISILNQFFLTLIYLRQHKTHFELSLLFNISLKDVSSIVITWIKFMSLQWREVSIWPSKQLVKFYAPTDFYNKFPSTRVILDGTEISINKPSLPTAQQATFSHYKNKNTVKVMIGSTPGGLTSLVSATYGGSVSDRQFVERNDLIPSHCDPGDSVMVDKGFDIQDLLVSYGIHVNIPTTFKKKNKLSCNTIQHDRKISSKRVHIERIIGLGKTYKILKVPLNDTEILISDDIVFVCFMLCNFKKTIVSADAKYLVPTIL